MTAPTEAGTAVVKVGNPAFHSYLMELAPQIEQVLPKIMRVADVVQAALIAAEKTPEILKCSRPSIALALLRCARLGLDIGEDIHLVPIKGKLEAWPDYKGLIRLAREAHLVRDIVPRPVYRGDTYSFAYGLVEKLDHVPCAAEKRGPLVAAWCRITLPGHRVTFHQMAIEDIEARRKNSRTWGPQDHPVCPPWYAMKTVVRDWLNRQPKGKASRQLAEALTASDAGEGISAPEDVDLTTGEVLGGTVVDGAPAGEEGFPHA